MAEEAEIQGEDAARPGRCKGVGGPYEKHSRHPYPEDANHQELSVAAAAWASISYQRDVDELTVPPLGPIAADKTGRVFIQCVAPHFFILVFPLSRFCYFFFPLQSATPQPPAHCLWDTVTPQVLGHPFQALAGWLSWDLIIALCTFLSSQPEAIKEGLGKSSLLNGYK